MERILVIAAHPDDEILGCGGTVRRLINEGNEAYSLILSDGTTSRYDSILPEVKESIEKRLNESNISDKVLGYRESFFCEFKDNSFDKEVFLDIVKTIERYVEKLKPSIIFTHHYGDLNIDHRLTFQAVQTATRPMEGCLVKEICCFETVSSTEWNFMVQDKFTPNYFVNIENTLREKIQAIKCYESEIRNYPHPRSIEGLETCAKRWGTVAGCNYAEAFEIIRKVDL